MLIDKSIEYKDKQHFVYHHLRLAIRKAKRARKEYDIFCSDPEAFGKRYDEYQSFASRCHWCDAIVRGLKNYDRGPESLDSFASHGGVNTPNWYSYISNKETQ